MAFTFIFLLLLASSACFSEAINTGVFHEHGREQEGREDENPYVFESGSFLTRVKSEAGEIRALPNFRERSELLRGMENYRVTYINMEPISIMLPHYIDAECISYVVEGRGRIEYLHEQNLVERKLEQGDVFGIPSGALFHITNNDDRQHLRIFSLLRTEPTPGQYESFYVAGGQNPETVYNGFSDDVLQAAFNTKKESIERILSRQRRGAIVRSNQEQIRRMSSRGSSRWSIMSSEEPKPFNLLNQKPHFSNNNGNLFEANARDYPLLGRLNVGAGILNLKPGSMMAPNYNTRSIKIGIVTSGEGTVEIACPHMGRRRSENQSGEQQTSYQKVQARLRPGTVFIVPVGHPSTQIASTNGQLQIMCFEINSQGNRRQFLAGRNNVLRNLEGEIRQLSFESSPKEIEAVLEAQEEEVILRGPQRQQEYRSSA
eukprot:Gb_02118 [translate_table: standard]